MHAGKKRPRRLVRRWKKKLFTQTVILQTIGRTIEAYSTRLVVKKMQWGEKKKGIRRLLHFCKYYYIILRKRRLEGQIRCA